MKIGSRALRPRALAGIAGAAFVGIYLLHVPFPWIILGAGVLGYLSDRIWPRSFGVRPTDSNGPEESPRPRSIEAAKWSWGRVARILAVGVLLWTLPFFALGMWLGWPSLQIQQYRFFTKAAFVTFGGAYAVLAYVTQAAVQTRHWISQAQAIDGLGLAETTPGPLIMVLQFVGFMTGWNSPGPLGRFGSASLGALVTTYVTFLPCFFYVLLCAPYIEKLRGNRALTAALSGITAAVVGVILNLAIVFGTAVLLPGGWGRPPDLFALALTVAAFVALRFLEIEAVWVVLAGAASGYLRTLFA